jgi:HlyD family secretion protein
MKKWGIVIALAIGSILLSVNIYLLLTNEFDRSKVIHRTTFAKKMDLRETMESFGVVIPSDEYSIYYNNNYKDIEEIYVEEGKHVSIGDKLFRYVDNDLDQMIQQLNNKEERLIDLLDKIEKDIEELESELYENDESESVVDTYKIVNDRINDKEYQKNLIELELDDIKAQISLLEEKKEKLVVTSKMDGTVIKVNPFAQKQNDIVVTIRSDHPYLIKGKASEFDIQNMTEGQKVITSPKAIPKEKLEGSIKQIIMVPLNKPSVDDKASYYPYTVELKEQSELLHPGYHMNLDIVLEEREDVIAVPPGVIVKEKEGNYLFVLKKGILEKRKVQLGLEIQGKQEIIKGIKEGEQIVINPSKNIKDQMRVVMPVQHNALKRKGVDEFTKEQVLRLVIKGMVE